ncbi:PAS domain-containing protein [Endothiovibrio diazotrophicus]
MLLVEADPADAARIDEALTGADADGGAFRVETAARLSPALERLAGGGIEVVLLDLAVPDGGGIEALERVRALAPDALILILCASGDEAITRQAVRHGAHDYLVKRHVDPHWVPRALHYALERKSTQDALRVSEARFRAMSDASPLGIFVSDTLGHCVYTNASYHEISGLTFEQALGSSWIKAIHPRDRRRVVAEWRRTVREKKPFRAEVRFLRGDGSIVWTRIHGATMLDGTVPQGHVQTVEDITARVSTELGLRAAEAALFEEKERAQVTLNSIGDAVLSTDLSGHLTYLNLVAEKMTGWSREEALGRPLAEVFEIFDGATHETTADPARRAIEEDRTVGLSADCVLVRRDGGESAIEDSAAPIHDREGRVCGAVIVFHDVSQSRAMARKMAHLAQHDALTGLPNRVLLGERLAWSIGLARRHAKQAALLFLDLDDFKKANDSLGHAIGDQLLRAAAERLVAAVRDTDTVCRHGGDEFVILLSEIEHPRDAARVAAKLLQAIAAPFPLGAHTVRISVSIGIAIYPDDGRDADHVMRNADSAMYRAKADGRNNYRFFSGRDEGAEP